MYRRSRDLPTAGGFGLGLTAGHVFARAVDTMFFHLQLERNIVLPPRFMGPRMREILYERLRTEARLPARSPLRCCLRLGSATAGEAIAGRRARFSLALPRTAGGGHVQWAVRLRGAGDQHRQRGPGALLQLPRCLRGRSRKLRRARSRTRAPSRSSTSSTSALSSVRSRARCWTAWSPL